MLLTREPQTQFGQLHPAEGCAEVPLLLRDEHLAELQQQATSGQRTMGQLIRLALGHYLAEARDRCGADGRLDDDQLDLTDGQGVLAVTLLLPLSRLAELDAIAVRSATTTSALIRRVVCSSLIRSQASQEPPKET